jgi:hypothetical protein
VSRWLIVLFALLAPPAMAADWVLSVAEPRVKAGARFEFEPLGPAGERLLDYNQRNKSQLRIGFAIVP